MKKLITISIIAILISGLSSCAIHSGYMNNSAALSQANFSYVKQNIGGTSHTFKVLGIGGLGKDALVDIAKNDMLENDTLQSNQALVNVSVNWKNSSFIVANRITCTVSADIVEFK